MGIKKKSIILFLSKSANQLITLFTVMILSRYIPMEEYGVYRQYILITIIISSIFNFGIADASIYYLSNKEDKEKGIYLSNIYGLLSVICVLIIILSNPISIAFDRLFHTTFFQSYWFLIGTTTALIVFTLPTENILIALDKTKFIPLYLSVPNIIWVLLITVSLLFDKGLEAFLLTYLIRYSAMFLLSIYAIHGQNISLKLVNSVLVIKLFKFGLPIGAAGIIGYLNSNLGNLLVAHFFNPETYAIFVNAAYELPLIGLLGVSLFNVMIPSLKEKIENGKLDELLSLWIRAGEVMMTLIIPIAICLITFSEEIITLLYSNQYIESAFVFSIYQITLIGRIYLFGSIFVAFGKSKLYMFNIVISLMLNLLLNFVLMKIWGPTGIAMATVCTTFILMLLQIIQLSHLFKQPLYMVFPWKKWCLSLVITIPITISMYLIYKQVGFGFVFIIISLVVNILLLSKVINSELLLMIKKYVLVNYLKGSKRINY